MFFLLYLFLFLSYSYSDICNRKLYETKVDKKPGDKGFVIEISSATNTTNFQPQGYIPSESYISPSFKNENNYEFFLLFIKVILYFDLQIQKYSCDSK